MKKKSLRLIFNVNFPIQFCLGSISNKFGHIYCRKFSLKGNVNDFFFGGGVGGVGWGVGDYNAIDKFASIELIKKTVYWIIKF